MATYQTPGVYVEETSYRARAVTGAPTAITAFVGPTANGPDDPAALPPLTSFVEFERTYGGFGAGASDDMAFAAHAFFAGGGSRLQVARVKPDASDDAYAQALETLDTAPEIELVAAPGAVARPGCTADGITRALIAHAEGKNRYRFAVLDAPPGLSVSGVRDFRAVYDSKFAALYHPWLVAPDPRPAPRAAPRDRRKLATVTLPPSPFVCAAYARTDTDRGVWKAPANTNPVGAVGLAVDLNKGEQDILNPLGVNCIRAFEGRGILIWGARTISSDPEYKYVSVRRLISHVEASLDRGLAWAVFEPNAPALWANVVAVAEAYLTGLWRNGALLGPKPEHAFFVRCGRGVSMTDLDVLAGRLILDVGLAVVRPAEFVIFRLQVSTVDSTA